MSRSLRVLFWFILGVIVLCIVTIVAVSVMNWNWTRPWVNQQLSGLTHRTVQIDGNLRVEWQFEMGGEGWRGLVPSPVINARDITIGNPQWAETGATMASAQAIRVRLDLMGLTRHVVRLTDAEISAGHVILERRADGVNNWTFGDDQDAEGSTGWRVVVDRLMLDDASLRVVDMMRNLDVTLEARSSDAATDQVYATDWSVNGEYRGETVSGEGKLGHVLALYHEDAEPFPVAGTLRIGDTTLEAEGTVTRPSDLAALDVQLELSGPTMADLYPVLGLALPHTPAYHTSGHLTAELAKGQDKWVYNDFTGVVGKSDLSGTVTYQRRAQRPLLTADLQSELLRFEDLGPLIGAPAGNEQQEEPQNQPDDKALPVKGADSQVWDAMDAEVAFVGQRIDSTLDLPLDDVSASVTLKDRVLRFEPLNFGVAGGSLKSTIAVDGTTQPMQVTLDAEARNLQLGQLFPGVESMDAALGAVHGDAHLTGRGNSVSAMLAHSSGELVAVVSQGTVSQFLLEAAGLNVANMVFVKIFGDEQVVLQCLAASFRIDDGLMRTQTFILETSDAVVSVDGQINLATEELDLDVHPDNKSLRIFTLRSPLYVRGTFKDPDVGVQTEAVAARAGAAVALGLVATPLAALLPLLNVGTDDTTTCSSMSPESVSSDASPGQETIKGSVPGMAVTQDNEP